MCTPLTPLYSVPLVTPHSLTKVEGFRKIKMLYLACHRLYRTAMKGHLGEDLATKEDERLVGGGCTIRTSRALVALSGRG